MQWYRHYQHRISEQLACCGLGCAVCGYGCDAPRQLDLLGWRVPGCQQQECRSSGLPANGAEWTPLALGSMLCYDVQGNGNTLQQCELSAFGCCPVAVACVQQTCTYSQRLTPLATFTHRDRPPNPQLHAGHVVGRGGCHRHLRSRSVCVGRRALARVSRRDGFKVGCTPV